MLKVGFIGWRGMVGSVLMQRMMEENDLSNRSFIPPLKLVEMLQM